MKINVIYSKKENAISNKLESEFTYIKIANSYDKDITIDKDEDLEQLISVLTKVQKRLKQGGRILGHSSLNP